MHILAISETHLANSFDEKAVTIQGYTIYRRDRNAYGGVVAVYVQRHIPVMLREDLMSSVIEVLWLQVHLPYLNQTEMTDGTLRFILNCKTLTHHCTLYTRVGWPSLVGSVMPPGVFSQSPGPEQIQEKYRTIQSHDCIELHLPSHIVQINREPGFKKQIKQHLMTQRLYPHVTYFLCVYTDMYTECTKHLPNTELHLLLSSETPQFIRAWTLQGVKSIPQEFYRLVN